VIRVLIAEDMHMIRDARGTRRCLAHDKGGE
jgi:hypothetical protein